MTVSVNAKSVLTKEDLPSVSAYALEFNAKNAKNISEDERVFLAKQTLALQEGWCTEHNARLQLTQVTNAMSGVYLKEKVLRPGNDMVSYSYLIDYFNQMSGNNEKFGKLTQNAKIAAFASWNHKPIDPRIFTTARLNEEMVSIVSTRNPLTLLCQAVMKFQDSKIMLRWEVVRSPTGEEKLSEQFIFNKSELMDIAAAEMQIRKENIPYGTITRPMLYKKLAEVKASGTKLSPEKAAIAVKFLVGDIEAEEAFNQGLRF